MMPHIAARLIALGGSLMIVVAPACVRRPAEPLPLTGTYEIFVCRGSCPLGDSSRAFAIGRLVLQDSAVALSPRPESPEFRMGWRAWQRFGPANGCYVFERRIREQRSYAGAKPVDAVYWRIDATRDSAIKVDLYQSVDAAHVATLVRAGANGVMRGTGHSSGVGATDVDWPDDSVVPRRIGPPNLAPCRAAARREWRDSAATPRRP